MKVIVLLGKKNSGKSTTFALLREKLLKIENANEILTPQDESIECGNFQSIISLENKLVSLNSAGDDYDCIKATKLDYNNQRVDVVVMVINLNHQIDGSRWLVENGLSINDIVSVVEVKDMSGEWIPQGRFSRKKAESYGWHEELYSSQLYEQIMKNI